MADRRSILSTIMRVESGGRNIPQNIDDINMRRGTPAQGYFQIINPTWTQFGGDKTEFKSAIDAPYATQLQIAQNIPVSHWGPATQEALRRAGYEPKPGETLGEMLARYKEDPTATRPEDVGGSSDGGTAVASAGATGGVSKEILDGLLASQQQARAEQAAALAKTAAEAEEAKTQQAYGSFAKMGMGLLGESPSQQQQVPPSPTAPIIQPRQQSAGLGPGLPGLPDWKQLMQSRLVRRV